ncbi:rho GTPase-activating protein 39-like [Corticium candelabrum]|uniref:rho GTPase-activating protein 39-like n=1 Tax=Corticium candelabrum TaxID=121492 RepID=UPI002E2632F7|nr:rho GTPase-activating protein 39-like [Corticium candelabrum]
MSQSSWREVVDPETRKVMFVNIETGECAWKLPEGETSIVSSSSDWWEFIDEKSKRHYYYQWESGKCQWRRPKHGNIVFMAKLQDQSFSKTDEDIQASGKTQKKPLPPKPKPYFSSASKNPKNASGTVGVQSLSVVSFVLT